MLTEIIDKIDKMDTFTIAAAGIGGAINLIIFIFSTILSRLNNRPAKNEIRKHQLVKVFEPLEKLLDKSGNTADKELIRKMDRIIYANFPLIPPKLLNEYKKLINNENEQQEIYVLKDIVSTNYNWIRRSLNYPWDDYAITHYCLEGNDMTADTLLLIKNSTLFAAFIILTLGFIYMVIFLIAQNPSLPAIIFQIFFLIFAIAYYIGLLMPRMRRKKGLYIKKLEKKQAKANKKAEQKTSHVKANKRFLCNLSQKSKWINIKNTVHHEKENDKALV